MTTVQVEDIIKEAEEFTCCPHCGNTAIEKNYCPVCEREFTTPGRATMFAEYLRTKVY